MEGSRRWDSDPLPPPDPPRSPRRLLKHSDVLVGITESLPLRVSDSNGVPADGSAIDIAWDFSL
jgi:hypothetical protein